MKMPSWTITRSTEVNTNFSVGFIVSYTRKRLVQFFDFGRVTQWTNRRRKMNEKTIHEITNSWLKT